jgi:cytochrome b subunit of formate dehydrogenase
MKTKYSCGYTAEKRLTVKVAAALLLITLLAGIGMYLYKRDFSWIWPSLQWLLLIPVFFLFHRYLRITENDSLVVKSFAVKIRTIVSIEEDVTKGLIISYCLQGQEPPEGLRKLYAEVKDSEKERLLNDLLSINPNIRIHTLNKKINC